MHVHLLRNIPVIIKKNINSFYLFLLLIAFILITIGQWTVWNSPAQGVETSFYKSTPLFYWIAYLFGLVIGFTILLRTIIKKDLKKSVVYFGLGLILYCTISFVTLNIVRGYYIYILINGDVGYHYGVVGMLLEKGTSWVHYPALHINSAITSIVSNLSHDYVVLVMPVFFVIILLLGLILVVRYCTKSASVRYLSFFVICLLPFGSSPYSLGGWSLSMFVPYLAGFCLVPLAIYLILHLLFEKNHVKVMQCLVIALITLISISFYHPIIYLVMMMMMVCQIFQHLSLKKRFTTIFASIQPLLVVFISSGIPFLFWTLIIKGAANSSIRNIFDSIFSDLQYAGEIGEVSSNSSFIFDFHIIGIVDMAIRYLGLLAISCIILALFLLPLLRSLSSVESQKILAIYPLPIIGFGYFVVSTFVNLSVQPGRLLPFIVLSAVIVAGFLLNSLIETPPTVTRWKNILNKSVFVIILISIVTLATIGYYPSMEENMQYNQQNTHGIVSSVDFYLTHNNYDYAEYSLGIHPIRLVQAKYHSKPIYQNDVPATYTQLAMEQLPHHIGYTEYESVHDYIDEISYLSISEAYSVYYSVTPQLKYTTPYFTQDDFIHLEYDEFVHKYYDNPSARLYLVTPY